jgi:uncharacterized membrane protein YdjX (TVP38/TMEM64 family)
LFRRFSPVLVLVGGLSLFFALGLDRFIGFDALRENREWLRAWVYGNTILAAVALIALYAVVVAFSLPAGAVLTITAGFLFGTGVAATCVVVGATLGATAVFLAARTAFADILRAKAGAGMRRMEAGFRENAWNYLLVLRLVPIFPFWLVNLVPAFLGVSLRTYVTATFIGIIPGTLVYASLGNGLGAIFEAGETPDLGIIFDPEVLLPILALAILAVLPIVY